MEDTVLGSQVPVSEVVHHVGDDHTIKGVNADEHQQVTNGDLVPDEDGKMEEEENVADGEFVKVGKELLDGEERSGEDVPQIVLSRSTRSDREELEIEIERLVSSLKHSESENARLKDDVSAWKQKLGELELNLNGLKEALVGEESKHKELMEVNESFEALVSELNRELELRNASESQIKEDMSAIECLFASSKEDLRSKISELEDTQAKMETQEVQISAMKAEFGVTIKEKEELEKKVENLTKTANQMEELRSGFEEKQKTSDENLCRSEELHAKISDLNAMLKGVEEEKQQLSSQNEVYKTKIVVLESAINDSSLRQAELENDLKSSLDRFTEHEDRANATHQRNLELEDLIRISQTKVGEMEFQIEAEKNKIQELEEQKSSLEKKCKDVEAESKKYYDKMSETLFELEAFQARASSLEFALAAAHEKERESTESLNIVSDEKKHLETAADTPRKKLAESENLLEMLRKELSLAQGKIESMENDLEGSRIRESEVIGKLKSAEEQLELSTTRNSELQLLHESSTMESEIKLQKAMTNFTGRDFDAKSLSEKLIDLEEKVKIYEEQVSEFATKSATLKDELDQSSTKSAFLESANEELKRQILEVESMASQYTSENELLVDTNVQLKSKVDELEKLISSVLSEKEMASQPIVSGKSSSDETMENHSRSIEADTHLREALQRCNQKDEEAKDLNDKLKTLECQLTIFQEHAQEASSNAEFHRAQMEETLLKLKHLESLVVELENKGSQLERENVGLAEANMRLAQEMAVYESKSIEYQQKLSTAQNGRGDAVDKFHNSERSVEGLTPKPTSEDQSLQSQISSVMEETDLLKNTHQNTSRKEETELLEKRIKELEQKLHLAESKPSEKINGVETITSLGSKTDTLTAEVSSIGTLKFILAVALVSVIIGIILGKRY